ncbi:MAG: nucleotide exchange factor GrpE [Candidatus Pacebacteria bacterium]|nr:nucleotide exchange factor GrpE [Candidatus Paceibacterota bacterium]
MIDTTDKNPKEELTKDEEERLLPEVPVDSEELEFENEEESENSSLVLKKVREKLHKCEQEKKEYLDGWQRMRADFINARKEDDARRGELIKFASEGLVEDLLPVLDSFTMAFANKEAWEKVDMNWRKGVEYIYGQLVSVLESRGLASIGTVGEKVDPRLHITVEEVNIDPPAQAGGPPNTDTVVEVVQKGYRLHSKIIRPAKVKVGVVKE